MVRLDPAGLRGEAERESDVELVERRHLPVKPCVRIGPVAVGPAQAGAQMPDAEPA